jgi:serine/threonine protein kinase/formylglycine-generating enzyme required for sulfatase activity
MATGFDPSGDLGGGDTLRSLRPGEKVLGRYRLSHMLGRGGMGVVWLARDEELGRDLAIKFLPEVVALDPEAVADLKRETNRCLDLTHPNIVRIYDFVQADGMAGITMEVVNGPTLAKLKSDQPNRCFSVAQITPWVSHLCDALTYAHERAKVVHRDLKPANLMLTQEGELKVTDFGISQSVSDTVSRVSQHRGSSGTPVYMSPQQMNGERADIQDDVYLFGATLYDLLTGKPPFYTGNILHQVENVVPPPMTARREELGNAGDPIPPQWEETIAACLSKERSARPQNIEEVARRLGLRAEPVTAPVELPPPPKKSALPWIVGLVALLLLGVGAGLYLAGRGDSRSATTAPPIVKKGAVMVRTDPSSATVSLGADTLTAPATFKEVPPGKYPLKVVLDGYATLSREITVPAGELTDLGVLRLERAQGHLRVEATPNEVQYEVRFEGKTIEAGKVPSTLSNVPVGDYHIRFTLPGWPDQEVTARVVEGGKAMAKHAFLKGSVRIESEPAGAEVVADGKVLGVTPITLPDIMPGHAAFALRMAGHNPARVEGELLPGGQLDLHSRLRPIERPTPGTPWTNSLGMKFVPVGKVLFCIWEARVADFSAFVAATGYDATAGAHTVTAAGPEQRGNTWRNPGFDQGPNHPVVSVSLEDAMHFCKWLGDQEQAQNLLEKKMHYRLPTDAEWSSAAGGASYAWGDAWPPPENSANVAGAEVAPQGGTFAGTLPVIGYSDRFPRTAPVGSFPPNAQGIHDLGGNVWEWCMDAFRSEMNSQAFYTKFPQFQQRVLDMRKRNLDPGVVRGGAWSESVPEFLEIRHRSFGSPQGRVDTRGFRVVLAFEPLQ